MKLAFRLDATVVIGSGHLMRCMALADAMRAHGAESVFIMECEIPSLAELLQTQGHDCRILPAGSVADWAADAGRTRAILDQLGTVHWLVVDHYRLDARWERETGAAAQRVMVIDDLADRPHHCDLLLDQNLHLDVLARYEGLVPAQCRQLLGPEYAMLRPEFQAARARLRSRSGAIERVAIFFGGTDSGGETLKALAAIADLQVRGLWSGAACDVIVGSGNPRRAEVERVCGSIAGAAFHCQIDNMSRMMQAADLCIGAGGTALWERAVLGLPSIVVSIADNQVSATVAMAQAGALLYLGASEAVGSVELQRALLLMFANPWLMRSLSARSLEQVDGAGLERVARALAPP